MIFILIFARFYANTSVYPHLISNDNTYLQFSKTFLSISTDFYSQLWSGQPQTNHDPFILLSLFYSFFDIVLRVRTRNAITVTNIFRNFFNHLPGSKYLSSFSISFIFILWSLWNCEILSETNTFTTAVIIIAPFSVRLLLLLCYSMRVFRASVICWCFTEVWVSESLFKSQRFISVFWLILILQ